MILRYYLSFEKNEKQKSSLVLSAIKVMNRADIKMYKQHADNTVLNQNFSKYVKKGLVSGWMYSTLKHLYVSSIKLGGRRDNEDIFRSKIGLWTGHNIFMFFHKLWAK